MKLNGSEIVMECLLEQGVDTVFGYPGGAVLNLYDALYQYQDRIHHILTAHEQGAVHAADGYARSSGKVGVVIATSGPGATNLVTGLATANMDSIPVVAITGNVGCSGLGLDSFQEVDITGVTMPITKHNYIVKKVEQLADTIREAFVIAQSGRPGPVLVDIPKDVSGALCEFSPKLAPKISNYTGSFSQEALQQAVELLKASKKPYIYTGGGVIASGAAASLKRFVNLVDTPVSSSLMGLGGFDNKDPRFLGMLGMHGTVASSRAVTDCDCFVGIGTRFSDRVIGDIKSFAPNAKMIQIEIDPAEINKNIPIDCQLVGDAAYTLDALCKALPQLAHPEWMAQVADWKREFPLEMEKASPEAVTPKEVLETLAELGGDDLIITTEVGQHQMWAAQFFPYTYPRQFVSSGGLGTMGFGLGASMGAQVANPNKRVVNIAGDGSFHMNCNELVSLSKHQIPVIELLMNNNVLGMVRQWQRLFYDKRFSQTTLDRDVDYLTLAKAYHIDAYRIEKASDIRPVLQAALAARRPVFIECVFDRDINVLPMIPPGGALDHPITELVIDD